MAPKKKNAGQNTLDIRSYLRKEEDPGSSCSTPRKTPGSSCSTPNKTPGSSCTPREGFRTATEPEVLSTSVKVDPGEAASEGGHSHSFKVKFYPHACEYTIECKQPSTVLEVIKSHLQEEFREKIKGSDEHILIKLGKKDGSPTIATHFPCCCVEDGECLVLFNSGKPVEAKKTQDPHIYPKKDYSIFFIDKEKGTNAKTKTAKIFKSSGIRQQRGSYCVYGRKEMTVVDTLRQDGRFDDSLRDFYLSDKNEAETRTKCTQTVSSLHQKEFRISLPNKVKTKGPKPASCDQKEQQNETSVQNSQKRTETQLVLEAASKKGISLKEAMKESSSTSSINLQEIYQLLRQQFPELKEHLKRRSSDRSFVKDLKMKKQNFGKIQQSFSEVHRMREMLSLGESICLLKIKERVSSFSVQGTGFVLLDNFVLTNAHLFDSWSKERTARWWEYLDITVEFNVENPDDKSHLTFKADVFDGNLSLDYILLELKCESQDPGETGKEKNQIPPGLLKRFGPPPLSDGGASDDGALDGGACIIGHPAGGVKKVDTTCVIRKEERTQAVNKNLESYKDYIFTVYSINQAIQNDSYANIRVTYNTFMYHGSSGSPVFDVGGRVFGLHSGGFSYDYPIPKHSVIEFCYPLLSIFQQLLCDLKQNGKEELLERVRKEAEGNLHLECIIKPREAQTGMGQETNEFSDSEESMELN